jgi:hypothetical protein
MLSYSTQKTSITVMDPLQKQFLFDNLIQAVSEHIAGDKRIIVQMAPTGSGKSTTLSNHTIFEFFRQFSHFKNIFYIAPAVECIDEVYEIMSSIVGDGMLINGKTVGVYNKEDVKRWIDEDRGPTTQMNIMVISTQLFYDYYEVFPNPNFPVVLPDLIINDEAHRGQGVPHRSTTLEDTGRTDNNFDPKWFNTQERLAALGSIIMHFTGTPTESQKMLTTLGSALYNFLPDMPKRKEQNCFTHFVFADSLHETADYSKKFFFNMCERVRLLQRSITVDTWKQLDGKIYKMMPGMIVGAGRDNATNGLHYFKQLPEYEDLANFVKGDLFASTSDYKSYAGLKIKRMYDGIKLSMTDKKINVPLVMIVKDSGKVGINIKRLNTAVVLRLPSQDKIHNAYTQFVARSGRLPFFRDHDQFIDLMKNINISDEQKELVIEYYSIMSTSYVILPNDSHLLKLVEEFYGDNTFTATEGNDYLREGIFSAKYTSNRISSYKLAHDKNQLYKMFRKDQCEVCAVQSNGYTECVNLAYAGFMKQYGKFSSLDLSSFNDFFKNGVLAVDHINGNHFDNRPENLVTECPNIHNAKTIIHEDYLNSYDEFGNLVDNNYELL